MLHPAIVAPPLRTTAVEWLDHLNMYTKSPPHIAVAAHHWGCEHTRIVIMVVRAARGASLAVRAVPSSLMLARAATWCLCKVSSDVPHDPVTECVVADQRLGHLESGCFGHVLYSQTDGAFL